MSFRRTVTSVLICSTAIVGCSDQSPKPPGPPANVVVVSGDAQQGTVATALSAPIVVKVTDASNRAVPGVTVTFMPMAGDGNVKPAQATTDNGGVALTTWTMPPVAADLMTLDVSVPRGEAISPIVATVHAKAIPDAVAALSIVVEPDRVAVSGTPLISQPVLRLVDRFGNDVPQANVVVAVAAIGHSFTHILGGSLSLLTDDLGRATFYGLTIYGPADNLSLVFSARQVPVAPVTSTSVDLLPSGT